VTIRETHPFSVVALETPAILGPACLATKDNGGEVEFSAVHACERKEVPSPTDATPVLAKGTASIELAGEAEKATAAKAEALEPGHTVRKDAGTKRH
jgi:hypothetical protein